MSVPAPLRIPAKKIDYPTSDGKPMAETDVHRDDMVDLIESLKARHAADPMVYVSGNILIYFEEDNDKRSVSPNVFVVRGIPKHRRDTYLVWVEGKGPDFIIEVSSKSTRHEDLDTKFTLYRDVLKVSEYFLFDPRADYLDPPLQGYHRVGKRYVSIRPVAGRLPSKVLGLHLERSGAELRLYDPIRGSWLPTPAESEAGRRQAEVELKREAEARQQAEVARRQEAEARQHAEAEVERLRREVASLRGPRSSPSGQL